MNFVYIFIYWILQVLLFAVVIVAIFYGRNNWKNLLFASIRSKQKKCVIISDIYFLFFLQQKIVKKKKRQKNMMISRNESKKKKLKDVITKWWWSSHNISSPYWNDRERERWKIFSFSFLNVCWFFLFITKKKLLKSYKINSLIKWINSFFPKHKKISR